MAQTSIAPLAALDTHLSFVQVNDAEPKEYSFAEALERFPSISWVLVSDNFPPKLGVKGQRRALNPNDELPGTKAVFVTAFERAGKTVLVLRSLED
jgi:hypothetical protein